MRVEVFQVSTLSKGIVRFRCESGVASGRWMGSNLATVGQFDVEIEVPEEVVNWTTTLSGIGCLSEIAGRETATLITGQIIRFDDAGDSVMEIRLGTDVLLIEISDRNFEIPKEGYISFRAPEIQLYPYDL
jgi:hypothetical protein